LADPSRCDDVGLAVERLKEEEVRLRGEEAPMRALYLALVSWMVLAVTWLVTEASVQRDPMLRWVSVMSGVVFGLVAVGVLVTRSMNAARLRKVVDLRVKYQRALEAA
jgi:xanthine/uracil permease